MTFTRTTAPQMMESVDMTHITNSLNSAVADNAMLLATDKDDFYGYVWPVAGIALLSALILYLSPPLADE